MHRPPRANFFDASALVKVYTDEVRSNEVRRYFNSESPTKYTTPFCYYETLTALKAKWLRGHVSRVKYLDSAYKATIWFQTSSRTVKDLNLTDHQTFEQAKELVDHYEVDLSDAFQILSVKVGYFSRLVDRSQTLLITADDKLRQVAEAEGLKVWYCMEGDAP